MTITICHRFENPNYSPKDEEDRQEFIRYWLDPRDTDTPWYLGGGRDRALGVARRYATAYRELFGELRNIAHRNGWEYREVNRWQVEITMPSGDKQYYALCDGWVYQAGAGVALYSRAMVRTWFHLNGKFHPSYKLMNLACILHGELGYRVKVDSIGDRWGDVILLDLFDKKGENYKIHYREDCVCYVKAGTARHLIWEGVEEGSPRTVHNCVEEAMIWIQLRQQEGLGWID